VEGRLAARPLLSCLGDIYRREGLAGLWKGSVPSIIKAAPAAALTFTAYEAVVAWMLAAAAARREEERGREEEEEARRAREPQPQQPQQQQQPERRRRKGD
jgi:solute carrier family 25 thiamine pyrophosphate transporter 19